MVLTRPVTRTKISTTDFGQPVYDWIVANTPTAWTNVVYQNGWGDYAGANRFQYRRIGDLVWLRGSFGGGTAGASCTTFPVGFRPPASLELNALTFSGTRITTKVDIHGDGRFVPEMTAVAISINVAFSTIL